MLWSIGEQISRQGAGLGNEIFPWAKAHLGAAVFGLTCVDPPWRLNPRRYDRDFGGGLGDSAKYLLAGAAPSVRVTAGMVRATAQLDYVEALRHLAPSIERRTRLTLAHASGMTGGYLAIRRARGFLQGKILGSRVAVTADASYPGVGRPSLRIGVHVRGGDFSQEPIASGSFNTAISLDWYRDVVGSLLDQLTIPGDVFLATDTNARSTRDALTFHGKSPVEARGGPLADLTMLSKCDIIVSSISSFALLAVFLSDSPYVWHRDQLDDHGGWLSIWGHEGDSAGGRPTAELRRAGASVSFGRGIPQGRVPAWPDRLVALLEDRARLRNLSGDLMYFGSVRADSS
jgi:hypothetical protein